MIVSFTGHRPQRLGGFEAKNNPKYEACNAAIVKALHKISPTKAISGMALGVDQWAAWSCIELGIPYIAAIPFAGQESVWPALSQRMYQSLIKNAERVEIVSEGSYAAFKMHRRNEWMVDNSDVIIAVWDGSSNGGTAECVKYASSKNKDIYWIDINNGFEGKWLNGRHNKKDSLVE